MASEGLSTAEGQVKKAKRSSEPLNATFCRQPKRCSSHTYQKIIVIPYYSHLKYIEPQNLVKFNTIPFLIPASSSSPQKLAFDGY